MKGPGLDMMFEGLYRAQSAWDQCMAHYASQASDLSERRIVVLAGSGHLLYNLGINRRAYEINGDPFKTVICLEIPENKATLRVSRSLADYVWGLSEEVRPAFPSIGLSFKKFEDLTNLVIEREPIDGVAKGGDFAKGDIVLSVDGKTFTEINALRIYLAQFRWDDEVRFRLLREAKEIEVVLKFLHRDAKNNST
jgi:S1-C subfamily serine protease